MNIIGWIVWGIALLILIVQVALFFHHDPGVGRLAKRWAFLIALGLAITALTDFSKLHLLWWVPFSLFLNLFFLTAGVNRKVAKFTERLPIKQDKDVKLGGVKKLN
jgi:hypothetical protein